MLFPNMCVCLMASAVVIFEIQKLKAGEPGKESILECLWFLKQLFNEFNLKSLFSRGTNFLPFCCSAEPII